MAEGKHRLSKVGKDLGVGIGTITDFLKTQGYSVETNPNAKITDEQYDAVLKEFAGDRKVKEEARQMQSDKIAAAPPSPVLVEEEAKPAKKKAQEEVLVKDIHAVEPREKIKIEEPKIISKIDIDAINPPKKERGKKKTGKEKSKEVTPSEAAGIETAKVAEVPESSKGKKEEPASPVAEKEAPPVAPVAPERPKEDFVPTKFSKLEGPTIIGKIELPQKPIASSNTGAAAKDQTASKKRKRIFIDQFEAS